jgi:2-polyprenyl-3-methyl-5-hydroxy-6-metoxy-1,4-benzoquinol methylase
MNNLEPVIACPMCGSEGPTEQVGMYPYFLCKCGMIFRSPRFTAEYLESFYKTEDYHGTRGGKSGIDQIIADEDKRAGRIVQELTEGETLLDIGCAKGRLLKHAKDNGYKVIGVEINSGYTDPEFVVAPSLEDIVGEFDVITCIHTLEHIIDFRVMAEGIKRLLKPGGLLIVEVPSRQSPGWYVDVHINFFTQQVVAKLFEPLQAEVTKYTPHLLMRFRKEV